MAIASLATDSAVWRAFYERDLQRLSELRPEGDDRGRIKWREWLQ